MNDQQKPVTSGTITDGYTLKVTSGDGLSQVRYNLSILTSVNQPMLKQLKVYPNPASDRIIIEGIELSSIIEFKNISGQTVKLIDYEEVTGGSVSVMELPAGIYLIYLVNMNSYSKPVKMIKL